MVNIVMHICTCICMHVYICTHIIYVFMYMYVYLMMGQPSSPWFWDARRAGGRAAQDGLDCPGSLRSPRSWRACARYMLEPGSKLLMRGFNVGVGWDPHYRATRLFTRSFDDGSHDDVHICVGVWVYYWHAC